MIFLTLYIGDDVPRVPDVNLLPEEEERSNASDNSKDRYWGHADPYKTVSLRHLIDDDVNVSDYGISGFQRRSMCDIDISFHLRYNFEDILFLFSSQVIAINSMFRGQELRVLEVVIEEFEFQNFRTIFLR